MADITFQRPFLTSYQTEFVDDNSKVTVVEAATKVGKTASMLLWLFEQSLKKENQIVWWVAPVYSQAKIAFNRMNNTMNEIEKEAKMIGLNFQTRTIKSPMSITLPNNSIIEFKSADNYNALYGQDVNAVVIDEATRCKEESWHAIRSTLTATRGSAKIVGNVRGRGNWVHKLKEKEHVSYYRVDAYQAVDEGILDIEEIENAKLSLPENSFRELYLALPSDDGGNPFDIKQIQENTKQYRLSPNKAKHFGIDVAKSQDWTVVIGVDSEGTVQLYERWQRTSWDFTIQKIIQLVKNNHGYIDSTGVGDPIHEKVNQTCKKVNSYKYNYESKQRLMELLALKFHQDEITVPSETEIYNELLLFEYDRTPTGKVTYNAPSGSHDDCVNALALAMKSLEDNKTKKPNIHFV